ncbi:MAG: orotidine-5'-phosphate decarboxylase [Actinobacteria bacterium]|nr:orotidine-5'-phosphate decarboxylase [Actinomycetota bacterium]MCL5883074.1 orotidine-5'-phosphate decarboxylase [Actinomycetota bacterium]
MDSNFADRLSAEILARRSQVCVGLDPSVERMPAPLVEKYRAAPAQGCGCGRHEIAECFEEFCAAIIDAVAPHAVAVKPQLACFEQYGPPGLKAFKHLCNRASRAGLLVVADAKRGDIGISAAAYSAAYIGRPRGFDGAIANLGADAITVNPLFGSDGMQPFLDDCGKYGAGIFVLVKTSNPGSAELQDLLVIEGGSSGAAAEPGAGAGGSRQNPRKLHEIIAAHVDRWGRGMVGESGYSSVGAVIGATHPEELAGLRKLLPRTPFLVPGYGSQGAGAADVAAAFDSQGLGALVTASRSIIYAGQGEDFAVGAAEAAERMRAELWQASRQ